MRARVLSAFLAIGATSCLLATSHDGAWPCDGDGDCTGSLVCHHSGGGMGKCVDPSYCDNSGDCPGSHVDCVGHKCVAWPCDASTDCQGFACTAKGCLTSCDGPVDCATGKICLSRTCVAQQCDPSSSGGCGGYVCNAGVCGTTCRSSADCEGGLYCTAAGTCVSKPTLPFVPTNISTLPLTCMPTGASALTCSSISIDTDAMTFDCDGTKLTGVSWAQTQVFGDGNAAPRLAVFCVESLVLLPSPVTPPKITGSRALVLVALLDFTLGGTFGLDGLAPGWNPRAPDGAGPGGGYGNPAGHTVSGGGGGYCTAGASGSADLYGSAGAAGPSYGVPADVPLVGGSGGGQSNGYLGGSGGGAIEIVAGRSITIAAGATLSANGTTGQAFSSGAGGGSGGSILLESLRIDIAGTVSANGGDGGSDLTSKGGAGAKGDLAPQPGSGDRSLGGGGGGGSAGRIRLSADTVNYGPTNVSPSVASGCTTVGKVVHR